MKNLPERVYGLFSPASDSKPSDEQVQELGTALAKRIKGYLSPSTEAPYLRPSNVGIKCVRQLWYSINKPELAEPLRPNQKIKYLIGHILEEVVLWLVELAGYEVRDRQRAIEVTGVRGSIDATVNGTVVDVKSASTLSFEKFKQGLTPETDAFGYLSQLSVYAKGLESSSGAFIAIDKQHGHITVDQNEELTDPTSLIEERKAVLDGPVPPRAFVPVPDGKSGNTKLDTVCSYCAFKKECWPGLRTFLYSSGPRYLTNVARIPDVPEVP